MKTNKIKFVCETIKWFDKVNGNTYHSNRIIRTSDGAIIHTSMQYGYGETYKQTAINTMADNHFILLRNKENPHLYERENNYPIQWIVSDGLKRECIANGKAA